LANTRIWTPSKITSQFYSVRQRCKPLKLALSQPSQLSFNTTAQANCPAAKVAVSFE